MTKKTIALAGNPNSGKTTLFNALTGSQQYVGNWPGVTVEKKEGRLKSDPDIEVMDLPGIYSLSPYSQEEVVARDYLTQQHPDAILNIIDGTNLGRNLYLTTQLAELGIPMVVAINMCDIVRKRGDIINTDVLASELGCPVVEISALKGTGIESVLAAVKGVLESRATAPLRRFGPGVEHALAHIEDAVLQAAPANEQRWYAVKLFERDPKAIEHLKVSKAQLERIEADIAAVEAEKGDDSEAVIAAERYGFIDGITSKCYVRKVSLDKVSMTDRVDSVLTNRFLALPIFALIMFLVYYISVTTVGGVATDWANDGLFGDGFFLSYSEPEAYTEASEAFEEAQSVIGAWESGEGAYEAFDEDAGTSEMIPVTEEDYLAAQLVEEPDPTRCGTWVTGIPVLAGEALVSIGVSEESFIYRLLIDGILGGVGAVLGFVPQIMVLFFLLAILELCGYMSRVAFILDRIFRKFGLSGKSFIPLLIGTGCGVPGILASRTIEDPASRRLTVMTTTFMPCGAKLPVIALFAGAIFGGAWWVAPSCYFLGIGAVLVSGIVLKKTKAFAGDVAPFIMELPAYHIPTFSSVMRSMWERAWAFIKKACTILMLACILIWFASNFGFGAEGFGFVENTADSLLAALGKALCWIAIPLGWDTWQSMAATLTGFAAKEDLVATFGILYAGEGGWIANLQASMTPIAAYSLLAFNLLCMPCFAAVSTIAREMNSRKWTWIAIGYEFLVAYLVSLWIYQLIGFAMGSVAFGAWTVIAAVTFIAMIYLFFRPVSKVTPSKA